MTHGAEAATANRRSSRSSTLQQTEASRAAAAAKAARPKRARTALQVAAAERAVRARQQLVQAGDLARRAPGKTSLSLDSRWVREAVVHARVKERIYFRHDDGELELRFTVEPSRIPGADDGLFAARPFKAGDTLTYYAAATPEDDLGQVGEQEAEKALKKLEVPKARYVMAVDGHYVVSYGCNNPAGLANDAGR